MTASVENLAYRWALHSPEFASSDSAGRAIANDPAMLEKWKQLALERYVLHENCFYKRSDVAVAVACISEPAHRRIIELASLEHENAGSVLRRDARLNSRKKGISPFYSDLVRLLLRDILPGSQMAVAYCNQRRQDLSVVSSFKAWKDREFYETSVLTMLRMRAQLRIEPPIVRLNVAPLPLTLNATIDASRNVTKTVVTERLADGKMRSTVTEE